MCKAEKKRNFYLSYIHVSLSMPKVQMTSPLVNSVTKLWTSKINISFLHMYPSLELKKKTLVYILLMYNWNISIIFSFIQLNQLKKKNITPSKFSIFFPYSTSHFPWT